MTRPLWTVVVVVLIAVGFAGCGDEGDGDMSSASCPTYPEVRPGAGALTPEQALDQFLATSTVHPNLIRSGYVRDDDAVLDSGDPLDVEAEASRRATFAHRADDGSVDALVVVMDSGNGWIYAGSAGPGYTSVGGVTVAGCSD
jgi:hypothetical protein